MSLLSTMQIGLSILVYIPFQTSVARFFNSFLFQNGPAA